MKISLIVLNFNQAFEIKKFLTELKHFWSVRDCVVVDDGSTDGSDGLAEELGFLVLRHDQNRGAGAAIRTGILWSKENQFEAVVIMSSNGKMRPCDISRVVSPVRSGDADYVTGNRYIEGGGSPGLTRFRRIAIPIFSWIGSILIGQWFSDITNGFRCYKIKDLFGGGMDIEQSWLDRYEMEYYIHFYAVKLGLRIVEVPVVIRYQHLEAGRKSKIVPLVGWWSMFRPLILLRLGLKK